MTTKNYMLAVLLCLSINTFAQYNAIQQSKWTIGDFYGLDFNNAGTPAIFTTSMDNAEGQASVCDASGDLLFYTNGSTIWNRNGVIMPNGTNLTGTGMSAAISTTQGALIVPMPDSAHKYYVFSLTAVSNCKLYCNIVDMNLDGGLGNVDIGYPLRLTMLRANLTEKMTAVPGMNNDVWVMVHKENSDSFLAYHITSSGLDLNPVRSDAGAFSSNFYQQGVMKFSPDGTKLLTCNFRAINPASAGLEVFDFDRLTGIVSNGVTLDNNSYYGGAFSADNTKVYAETTNTLNQGTVFQFDLSQSTPSATKTSLGPSGQYTDMKLAPDGKIYFGALAGSPGWSNYKYLGCINNPNLPGTLCGFQDSVTSLYFPHPTSSTMGRIQQGMPNEIAVPVANPLSLKNLLLRVNADGIDAVVSWEAEGEEQLVSYTLERSFDGRSYDAIYFTGVAEDYSFSDKGALNTSCHLYYRLRVKEKSGNESYSQVVHLYGIQAKNTPVFIYPNPVRDVAHIYGFEPAEVTILDMAGKVWIRQANTIQLEVKKLPAGIYQMYLHSKKGNTILKLQFVKAD